MAKYTQIPTNTFEQLVINAGILCEDFTPSTGEVEGLIGATSGGLTFEDTPSFSDFGDDIDNCPKNTKQLKRIQDREVKMSGTFVTMSTTMAKKLAAAADIDGTDTTKVTPRLELTDADFDDLWLVGDYSNINEDGSSTGKAGYIAIKLLNGLSTGGLKIATSDKAKGKFDFEFMGHYDLNDQKKVPYELYIKAGTADPKSVSTKSASTTAKG